MNQDLFIMPSYSFGAKNEDCKRFEEYIDVMSVNSVVRNESSRGTCGMHGMYDVIRFQPL